MDAPGHLDEELNSTSPGGTVRNWAHVPPFNPATAKVGIILPPGRTDLGLAMPSEQERDGGLAGAGGSGGQRDDRCRLAVVAGQ